MQSVWLIVAAIVVFAFALVYPVFRKRLLTAKKITRQFVWLDKVNQDYLEQFPPLPAPQAPPSGESA